MPQEIFNRLVCRCDTLGFHTSLVADHYGDAKVAHLGDGAGGYRRMNGASRPDEQWGTFDFLNTEKGFENVVAEGFNYESIYIAAAKAHPEIMFAEFGTAEDSVQKRFLAISGAQDVVLMDALQANHADIRAEVDNFRAFITGGESHDSAPPEFYACAADGVSIRDWVADLAAFNAVENVTCQACEKDTYIGGPLPPAMPSSGTPRKTPPNITSNPSKSSTISTMSASTGTPTPSPPATALF